MSKQERALERAKRATNRKPTTSAPVSPPPAASTVRKKLTVLLEEGEYLQAVKVEREISDALLEERDSPVGHSELFRALLAEMAADSDLQDRVRARIESGDLYRPRGGAA